MHPNTDEILTAKQVSALLGVGISSVYQLLQSGSIEGRLIGVTGKRGTWRVLKSKVFAFLGDTDNNCELCRKYGNEPNAETAKALEASMRGEGHSKPFKTTKALFDSLDKE